MKPSVGWALVGMQFGVLSALLVFPAGDGWPRNWIVGAGAAALLIAGVLTAVVASFRLGTSLTPLPIPKNNGTLARDGIYRTVRHPHLHRGACRGRGRGRVGRFPSPRHCLVSFVGGSECQSVLRRSNAARKISGLPRLSKNIRAISAALEQPFPAKK